MTMEGDSCRLALDGEMTIYTAAQLLPELKPHIERPQLALSLETVHEIDGAGLQLLLLMRRERAEVGHELTIETCSEPVRDVLNLCGLASAFGLEPAAARLAG
jgi:anti-anti-sigma factor